MKPIARLSAVCLALMAVSAPALAQTEIQWWHSMSGALGDRLNGLAERFNKSQTDYKVVPVFKGSYPESMAASIAAYRAGPYDFSCNTCHGSDGKDRKSNV